MGSYVYITSKILKSLSLKLYSAEQPTDVKNDNDYNNRNKKHKRLFNFSASDDMLQVK